MHWDVFRVSTCLDPTASIVVDFFLESYPVPPQRGQEPVVVPAKETAMWSTVKAESDSLNLSASSLPPIVVLEELEHCS